MSKDFYGSTRLFVGNSNSGEYFFKLANHENGDFQAGEMIIH
jgi:hypothetical protein